MAARSEAVDNSAATSKPLVDKLMRQNARATDGNAAKRTRSLITRPKRVLNRSPARIVAPVQTSERTPPHEGSYQFDQSQAS